VKSNREWIQWGKSDPLFGVASWPGHERGGPQEWTDEDFYELGRSDWADFIGRWVVYGVDTLSCVEIGSGAGRLTKHMASTFGHLYAFDVSAEMLDYAKRNIVADNVTFIVTNGLELPVHAGSVAAVFSAHVFQHFASLNDATSYFKEIARVLASKGSLMVHLPVHVFPAGRTGMRLLYTARRDLGKVKGTYKGLASRLGMAEPMMRGLSYEISWLVELLRRLGFTDVEFVFFPVTANDDLHSFMFARKR
jgi:ubiquinone/menaquinone biosynthesis C-methylase UbiE